jgi:hypothetical protein
MLIAMLQIVPMFSAPKHFVKDVMYSISHVENLWFFNPYPANVENRVSS